MLLDAYLLLDEIEGGLTGGTIWTRLQRPELQQPDPRAQFQPKHIPIMKNDKPCVETLQAARISQDGVLGAFVFESKEIFVYKFID